MVEDADCLIFAVGHDMFRDMTIDQTNAMFGNFPNEEKIIVDVKSILDKDEIEKHGYSYWRL